MSDSTTSNSEPSPDIQESAIAAASEPQESVEPVATQAETSAPSIVQAPDPCSLLSPDAIADAAGVGGMGTPTPSTDATFVSGEDAWGSYRDITYCKLSLSDGARTKLGIDTVGRAAQDLDILVAISAYNNSTYSSAGSEWSDSNPSGLVSSYVAANSEKIGTNPIAERVSDTVVQDGSTVIAAVNDRYWSRVTLFGCYANVCGPAALAISNALVPVVPGG